MSKPYFVGWYDAFKWLFNQRQKSYKIFKLRIRMWKKLLDKKYFWFTSEELVKSNEECWNKIGEIDFPKGFFVYTDEDYGEKESN